MACGLRLRLYGASLFCPHITRRYVQSGIVGSRRHAVVALLSLSPEAESAEIHSRLNERQRERERVARELHDTLLQGFQGLVLRFQAILNRIPEDDPLRASVSNALLRADEVLIEGRDRVREIRSEPSRDLHMLLGSFGDSQTSESTLSVIPCRNSCRSNHSLAPRYTASLEVRQLLKKPDVLEQRRTPFAGSCDVLIVVDGGAECCRKFLHMSPWVLRLTCSD
jgi:hypothetical protein